MDSDSQNMESELDGEGEIEFLDEDADIVQHCINITTDIPTQDIKEEIEEANSKLEIKRPFLVERASVTKIKREPKRKKRKVEDDDTDYDPTEDLMVMKKKKKVSHPPAKAAYKQHSFDTLHGGDIKTDKINRNDIRIPDYEDPLCLPVRAVKMDKDDADRLKHWNNLCLRQLTDCDSELMQEEVTSTKNVLVLRKVKNHRINGKFDTTVWSKTTLENAFGKKKSEVVQSTLPRFKEKKTLEFHLAPSKKTRTISRKEEVILCKETYKDGEVLVVYKPKESRSSVYKFCDEDDDVLCNELEKSDVKDDSMEQGEKRRSLKEIVSCRACGPCYQTSWRGGHHSDKKHIKCVICTRSFVSVYNLLAHLKTHSKKDVALHKKSISKSLSTIVDYHYRCRICRSQFGGIGELRAHVARHRGNDVFFCDIGNHMVNY